MSNIEKVISLAKQAIDVHCHGVGRFDFTEIPELNLPEIEAMLASREHRAILTLYLPQNNFEDFLQLMDEFDAGRKAAKYKNIVGIGLEGPLLASHGGTPHKGVWNPTKRQWKMLSECGKRGLVYSIFSPDATLDSTGSSSLDTPATNVQWIAETLLDGGVLPAAGHFVKSNPVYSAVALQSIYDVVRACGKFPTLTDHLYNDMPHNFIHAWRTPEARLKRDQELKAMNLDSWTLDNIEEKLGSVPATMIRNAQEGLVKIAINFDGEHVDLAILKKTVQLVGAENILMMTDSIESRRLAGRDLSMHEGSTLLYQDEDIVAAGSQGILQQIDNMMKIGLTSREIKLITQEVASSLFAKQSAHFHAPAQIDCI
jgi:hypothetical protein